MQRNEWSVIVSWQTRRLDNSTKYLLTASMTSTLKKKKWNLLENCHKYAPKLFWNVYTWHVLGDLIIVGQWTNLHDRSQNGPKPGTNVWIDWYLTFITHVNTNSIAMWVTLQNNAGWDCFKTPILQDILRTQKSTSGGTWCVLGSHTFVPISWMCKKQISVSHSSTESEIISLDAGLRLDGIHALDLWDLIVFVLGNTIQTHDRTGQPVVNCDKSHGPNKRSQGKFNVLNNVDFIPSNVNLHIKMIIKGRSPTMRLVSRTHRVALDWTQKSKSSTSTPKTNLLTC